MKITYLFLTLLAFNVISANGQTADFTFTAPNNIFCSPQVVTFTSTATGNPTNYLWDFGDGQSGGNALSNHLYDYPGTYNVTFTAVYANSASTITKAVVINPAPVVTLNANRTSLCQPGNVTFTASATGTISSYEWNFGDGSPVQSTTTNSIVHNFTNYGAFNVTVKVTSTGSCTSTAEIPVQVARFPISLTVTPSNGCLPVNATLAVTTTFPPGDALQNIVWNFGDGTPTVTGSSSSIVHTYNTTNPITTAGVSIMSAQGCTNQYTVATFAYGIPPTNTNAYTTALRDTFCGSETIQFYGYADSANSYLWDFGDGVTDSTSTTLITHKYSTLGNKVVVVTPYYNGCQGPTRSLNIFITGVIASYTYANTCTDKATYNFTNNSLGSISSYAWTYSDMPGFFETTNFSPSHTFPQSATSIVNLTIVDNITGCRDSLSSTIYTATPSLVTDKMDVCKDSAITYTVQNTYPAVAGYHYEYHVNGLVLNGGPVTSFTYNPGTFGTFNDFVIIRDLLPGTCDDTLYVGSVNVRGPVISVLYPTVKCEDSAVIFTNLSYPWFDTDTIVKWKWDFGDGQKDSVQNPTHLYTLLGMHGFILEATDINGCRQKFQAYILTAGLPNISILPAIDTLCLGQTAMLTAYTSDSLIWQNNTINCTYCDTVYVSPAATTDYIAMSMTEHGCKRRDTATVKVFGPLNLSVTPSQSSVCAGTSVQFNLNTGGNITWSPPNFLNNATIQNPVSTPTADVTYTIKVRDSVGCFTDSVTASITVFPDPVVNAGPDQYLPYNTPFTLSPVYAPGTQTYLWTPAGNLNCTNCPSPSGVALQKQEFTIEVTDANNCTGKDNVTIFVGCELSNLLLPSAFTPNGDGRNEWFYPIARGYKEIKSFTVFNRNGAKVFERKNFQPNISSEGWDGRVKNAKGENTQSYVWIIEGICDTGMSIVTKGSVLLIR